MYSVRPRQSLWTIVLSPTVSRYSSTCTGSVVVRSTKYTTCCPNNAVAGCSYTFPPVRGVFYAFPPVACAGLSPPVALGVGFIGDDASADWDCCRCGGISLLLIEGLIANSEINKSGFSSQYVVKLSSHIFTNSFFCKKLMISSTLCIWI